MEINQANDERQLLKKHFNYPIFMYEAEKVGISATGEEDQNELYPNPNKPVDCERTCLEWYREFRLDPDLIRQEGD
jgi:type I restriction enzyme M protein